MWGIFGIRWGIFGRCSSLTRDNKGGPAPPSLGFPAKRIRPPTLGGGELPRFASFMAGVS
jgi:hypothetical protein